MQNSSEQWEALGRTEWLLQSSVTTLMRPSHTQQMCCVHFATIRPRSPVFVYSHGAVSPTQDWLLLAAVSSELGTSGTGRIWVMPGPGSGYHYILLCMTENSH